MSLHLQHFLEYIRFQPGISRMSHVDMYSISIQWNMIQRCLTPHVVSLRIHSRSNPVPTLFVGDHLVERAQALKRRKVALRYKRIFATEAIK